MEKDVFNHIVSSYVLMESKILFTQEKGSNHADTNIAIILL